MNSTLTVINKTSESFAEDVFAELAEKILIEELADQEGMIQPAPDLCLILCEGEMIRELNRKYRGTDAKTDVLSFRGDYPEIPQLGDIIIDIEKAFNQKGDMSLNFEVQTLFLHGLLHLLGYDHITQKQQLEMHKKEKLYRKYIKEISK
ncbi:MAG: rRNA maturation RNase YbeY [Candidatus Cloacimonetes bacterium]|nr:rRNA maturation RNase YbeY [Candidatus Cloacimonadota bacterium]